MQVISLWRESRQRPEEKQEEEKGVESQRVSQWRGPLEQRRRKSDAQVTSLRKKSDAQVTSRRRLWQGPQKKRV